MSKICLVWNFSLSGLSVLMVLSASTRPLAPTPSRSAWRNFSRDSLFARLSASTSGCIAFSLAILPRPTAASRAISTLGSCTSLMSVSVHFGSASLDSVVATSWRTLSLSSPASDAILSIDTSAASLFGVEGRKAVEPLHAREVAEFVLGEHGVERRRLLERHEGPADLRLVALVGFEQGLEQHGLGVVGGGRAEVDEGHRRGAAHGVIGAGEPLDHRRDARLVLGPREVHERLLLEARLGLHVRPLAPPR